MRGLEQLVMLRSAYGAIGRQPYTNGADDGDAETDAVTDGVPVAVHVDDCDGLGDCVAVVDPVWLEDGDPEAVDEWDADAV